MGIIREMREVCQQRRPTRKGKMVWKGHWSNRFFTRYFSVYITWVFAKLAISANTVTLMMLISGAAGIVLLMPHLLWLNLLAALALEMFFILDCVDGEVARWTRKTSVRGVFLDLVSHVFCRHGLLMICAMHAYFLTGDLKYVVLALVGHIVSLSRHASAKSYLQVAPPKPKASGEPPARPPVRSRKHTILSTGLFLVDLPLDDFVSAWVSIVAVLLSHGGILQPLLFLAWFYPLYTPLLMLLTLVKSYFSLPPAAPAEGH
jgi:phosphatidylglycerophosphate synthase